MNVLHDAGSLGAVCAALVDRSLATHRSFGSMIVDRPTAIDAAAMTLEDDEPTFAWVATRAGLDHSDTFLAERLDAVGARRRVVDAANRFDIANPELKALCADVGLRPTAKSRAEPSPGSDYDSEVIDRLIEFHRRCHDMLDECDNSAPWMGGHRPRLDGAVTRVRSGDIRWFTSPAVESYHQVWFELHEIILATLGRTRSGDTTPTRGEKGSR